MNILVLHVHLTTQYIRHRVYCEQQNCSSKLIMIYLLNAFSRFISNEILRYSKCLRIQSTDAFLSEHSILLCKHFALSFCPAWMKLFLSQQNTSQQLSIPQTLNWQSNLESTARIQFTMEIEEFSSLDMPVETLKSGTNARNSFYFWESSCTYHFVDK